MKRALLGFLLFGSFSQLSGCAVIDFLDGKNFDHTRDDIPSQQYSSGGNGGGHSHH
jgi:hypothetical protein